MRFLILSAFLLASYVVADYVDEDNEAIVIEVKSSSRTAKQFSDIIPYAFAGDLTYQFRSGQGACVSSKAEVGKCTNLKTCYPFYQFKENHPAWVYGTKESCNNKEEVCCTSYTTPFPGVVSAKSPPQSQAKPHQLFLYPASTMPMIPTRQLQDGQFQGGQFPGGQFPGQYPGAQFPGGQLGGQFPGGQGGQFPGGQWGQFPGGQWGQFPGGQGGQFPGGQGGQFPSGQEGQFPGGQGGQFPSGQEGQFPGGQDGQFPSGGFPTQQPPPQQTQFPPSIQAVEAEQESSIINVDNDIQSSVGSGNDEYSKCGTNKYDPELRVAGGTDAQVAEFPWGVALFNRGRQFCGGSIINPTHILTAAHCVASMTSDDAKQVTVRVGDHNLDDPNDAVTQEKRVKLIVKNKLFSMSTLHHDVAIIVLDSPITYTENVRPICLAGGGDNYAGKEVTVSGWGLLRENGPRPTVLQKLTMNAWNQEDCKKIYTVGSPAGITPHMLCAGQKGKDSCSGDSGGPLVHKREQSGIFEQVGIVSWGIGCGKEDFPGVYTRVTEVRDWIDKVISTY